jgi:hypothetical protein
MQQHRSRFTVLPAPGTRSGFTRHVSPHPGLSWLLTPSLEEWCDCYMKRGGYLGMLSWILSGFANQCDIHTLPLLDKDAVV